MLNKLSTKFILLAVANVAALGILFLIFVQWQSGQDFESFLMTAARERIFSEARSIALEMRDSEPSTWNQILTDHSATHGVTFAVYRQDGELVAGPKLDLPEELKSRLLAGPRSREMPMEHPAPGRMGGFGPALIHAKTSGVYEYWVVMRTFLPPLNDERRPSRGVIVIASPDFLTNPFFFQLTPLIMIGVVAMAVSALCWLPLVRSLTRSIAKMTDATAKIAEGGFDTQVQVKRHDELGLLAASINRMAARLGAFSHGQKRFLGDVAHELRSPLGRMQLALGILDRKVDESAAGYLKDLADDVKVMSGLTDGLLEFAKAEMRQDTVVLSPINVADVVWRAVKAESRPGVEVSVEIDPMLMVKAETECLFRAIANVIRNSIRYAGQEGPIVVGAFRAQGEVSLTVTDAGPGVPPESVDQIFEPFYRLEYARDRESGGAGLGLAIVKSCIEACGGRVTCKNRLPHGLEVSMVLASA